MDEKLNQGEDSVGMTDLQFLSYKEERDKREALEKAELLRQIDALRGNASAYCGEGMTDFQYKNTIEMIYQILKANFEAGKTPEEILTIIAALKTR